MRNKCVFCDIPLRPITVICRGIEQLNSIEWHCPECHYIHFSEIRKELNDYADERIRRIWLAEYMEDKSKRHIAILKEITQCSINV